MQARKLGFSGVEVHDRLGIAQLVRVSWPAPGDVGEPPHKRRRSSIGNVFAECGVCSERKEMEALLPCGHLLCRCCIGQLGARRDWESPKWKCPFCKGGVDDTLPLFRP